MLSAWPSPDGVESSPWPGMTAASTSMTPAPAALLHRSAQGLTPGIFALSPDGSRLAVCGPDHSVMVRRIDQDVPAVAIGRHHEQRQHPGIQRRRIDPRQRIE